MALAALLMLTNAASQGQAEWRLHRCEERMAGGADTRTARYSRAPLPDSLPRLSPPLSSLTPSQFFGRIASTLPWMKALICSICSAVSLSVKSGMPSAMGGPLNTKRSRLEMISGAE